MNFMLFLFFGDFLSMASVLVGNGRDLHETCTWRCLVLIVAGLWATMAWPRSAAPKLEWKF